MKKALATPSYSLGMSTVAFTICFAVWTIFAIIGIQIKQQLGLTETQFGLLIGTPILTGSLTRLMFGIWAEQYGARLVYTLIMLAAALSTYLLTFAQTYEQYLLAALGVGLAGGAFVVGVVYVSHWYPREQQGTALGVFGMGNIGAAVTKFVAPFVMVLGGWELVANIWATGLAIMAIIFWLTTSDDPIALSQKHNKTKIHSTLEALAPLRRLQVWRFSLYYFFVFGGFVALALWLPRYLGAVYGLDIKWAGVLAASFSFAASFFRAIGGYLSDKYGARRVMYWTFISSSIVCFLLSYPATNYIVHGTNGDIQFSLSMGLIPFIALTFALGFAMSLGKAAVYKHIPVYYPDNVGSVAGLVGLIGGLGGFIMPIVFGYLNDLTGVWTSCFMILFVLVTTALIWMHLAILRMDRREHPQLKEARFFPEFQYGAQHARNNKKVK